MNDDMEVEFIGPDGLPLEGASPDGKTRARVTWLDGAHYQGEWSHRGPHGQGKIRFESGDVFEGEWRNGQIDGYGVYQFKDGRRYEGEICDSNFNGQGTLTSPDGAIREGEFIDGELVAGRIVYADGLKREHDNTDPVIISARHDRRFVVCSDIERDGFVSMVNPEGYRYEGEIVDGNAHGYGCLTCPNRIRYEGTWAKGYPDSVERVNLPGWQEHCRHSKYDRVSKVENTLNAVITYYRCECGGETKEPGQNFIAGVFSLALCLLIFFQLLDFAEEFWKKSFWSALWYTLGRLTILLAAGVGLAAAFYWLRWADHRYSKGGKPWLQPFEKPEPQIRIPGVASLND